MTMHAPPSGRCPYVGPRAFETGEKLYGRKRETKRLLNLLIAERIVLLYSPSGAGKTSLIQAALIPELEAEGFQVLPPMRVNMEAIESSSASVKNRNIFSLLLSLEEALPSEAQIPVSELADMTLDDYLSRVRTEENDGDVLIFDQFEEILTVDPTDREAKIDFFEQVGKALQDRERWALFSMREEFIAALDPYLLPIPTRFSTTFRLELLGVKAALQAAQEPARSENVHFTDAAANKLIDDLRTMRFLRLDGSTAEALGHYVEPVQLQVVCRRLWERLAADVVEIDINDVEDVGDVDSALRGYYAERVAAIAAETGVRERAIRDWVDAQLITEQGFRGQVLQGIEISQGLDNRAIGLLVDSHLLRAEQRRGATWFELAHDRLIEPVQDDNAAWREAHLSALQRQAALWEREGRPGGLLLQDEALAEAEGWVATHQDVLESHEEDFLDACRAARRLAQRERRLFMGMGVLTILSIIAAVVAFYFYGDARQQTERAVVAETEAIAEAQRAEAEAVRAETEAVRAEAEAMNATRAQATAEAERDRVETQSLIAQSRQVVAMARNELDSGNAERALLLAIGAHNLSDTVAAEDVLHQALAAWSGRGVLEGHERRVSGVEISPDGRLAATAAKEDVRLWEFGGERRMLPLIGHAGEVTDMKFTPDGRHLATTSRDGSGRLWDVETGELVWEQRFSDEVISVAVSPDGEWIAYGGLDGVITVWHLDSQTLDRMLRHNSWGFPIHVVFSPDGRYLAAAYNDNMGRVWQDDKLIELHGHDNIVWDIVFSPDGEFVATVSDDNTVRLWNPESGEPIAVSDGYETLAGTLRFSPNGRYLTTSSKSGAVYLWDVTRPANRPVFLDGHTDFVSWVVFSPDGRYLASVSWDGSARLWDLRTMRSHAVFLGHADRLWKAAFTPDAQYLLTVSSDNTARLWDVQEGGEAAFKDYGGIIKFSAYVPEGDSIVTVQDGFVHSWNPETGDNETIALETADVRAAALSSDGLLLAVSDKDGKVSVWDLSAGLKRNVISAPGDVGIHDLAFHPDGQRLATAGQDGVVRIWNVETREAEATLTGHTTDVYDVIFSADGEELISGGGDGSVRVWDWRDGGATHVLETNDGPVWAVALPPDGSHIAAGNHAGEIWVWYIGGGEVEMEQLPRGDSPIRSLAFHPDGLLLAAGSEDGVARVWNLGVEEPVELHGHERWLDNLSFHPGGDYLVSASQDGMVRVWPASAETTIDLACSRVGQGLTEESWQATVGEIPFQPICADATPHAWTEADHLSLPDQPSPSDSQSLQPAGPVIYYFEAVPGSKIRRGEEVALRWEFGNAKEGHLFVGDEKKGVVGRDQKFFKPEETTVYRLRVVGDHGEIERKLTITVMDE